MPNSQQEALKRMSKLVNSLLSRNDCGPFREPVDWRGLELFDYPKIIKKMMDLGTVKRKLERDQYATAHECAEDIRLVWKNCWTYNADGSDFWLLAKSFSRRFEDKYKKIKTEFDVGEPDPTISSESLENKTPSSKTHEPSSDGKPISLDSKSQLASKIFLLSGVELAHVMTTIETRCPQALEPLSGEEEVEINVDALDYEIFAEINRFVQETVASRHVVNDQPPEEMKPPPVNKKRKK